MPILNILFVAGVVLTFGSLMASFAWGVHQTKDIPLTAAKSVAVPSVGTPIPVPLPHPVRAP